MSAERRIFVVDDDSDVRDSLAALLSSAGHVTETFDSAAKFLSHARPGLHGCVIADIRMPDMDGLELQKELVRRALPLSVIFITGYADVPLAVRAMKAGAIDFLEKPFDQAALLASIGRALKAGKPSEMQRAATKEVEERVATLTERERQVLDLIVEGNSNKVIAYHLTISPRTVELHRANVMDKMHARNVAELVRTALPLLEGRKGEATRH
jgi:two-component system, LuxR family, response regulator FixJ